MGMGGNPNKSCWGVVICAHEGFVAEAIIATHTDIATRPANRVADAIALPFLLSMIDCVYRCPREGALTMC